MYVCMYVYIYVRFMGCYGAWDVVGLSLQGSCLGQEEPQKCDEALQEPFALAG